MKTAITVARMLVRLLGVILIILGLLFWTGNAESLIPIHILLGILLVLTLWVLAFLAFRAGVSTGFVLGMVVWGLIVLLLGLNQAQLFPGDAHWVTEVLHLLVGVGAIGLAEALGGRIKRAAGPALRA